MSSTSIYENLPLKKLDSESESLKNSQNIPDKQKKRKSTPDIQKISPQNNIPKKPKSSRSISEMFFNRNHEANDTEAREIVDDKAADDSSKKVQSTPTSTLDDGYESCNSTPLVSGRAKPSKHHSNQATNIVLTCTLRKSEYEGMPGGFDAFALQRTSTCSSRRTRKDMSRSCCRPAPARRARWIPTPLMSPTRAGRLGARAPIFYCPSSDSRSIWLMCGDFLIFVIRTGAVGSILSAAH
jgi:hypothetical protein